MGLVLDSVTELFSSEFSRVEVCELNIDEDKPFEIQDQQNHTTPCAMCNKVDCGPRCMWLCCGFVACQSCAWWYYAKVCPYGVCIACDSSFPTGWTITDMLVTPPPQNQIKADFKLVQRKLLKQSKGMFFCLSCFERH